MSLPEPTGAALRTASGVSGCCHGPETAGDGGSVASDRAALVALYEATEGANWARDWNWLTERPIGQWYGVTTNSVGRVTKP